MAGRIRRCQIRGVTFQHSVPTEVGGVPCCFQRQSKQEEEREQALPPRQHFGSQPTPFRAFPFPSAVPTKRPHVTEMALESACFVPGTNTSNPWGRGYIVHLVKARWPNTEGSPRGWVLGQGLQPRQSGFRTCFHGDTPTKGHLPSAGPWHPSPALTWHEDSSWSRCRLRPDLPSTSWFCEPHVLIWRWQAKLVWSPTEGEVPNFLWMHDCVQRSCERNSISDFR